jgi:hypothetical protein
MLTTHADTDESPHPSDTHELWQESSAVAWLDAETGAGGYFRIGHEPNTRGGEWALAFGVVTRDGLRYRRNEGGPLTDADRPAHGLGARDGHFSIDWDGALQVRAEDDRCRLELTVDDFYPRTDFFGLAAGAVREVASSHFESSGTIRGTILLDGRSYDIDGLCHRDRSWGMRRWDTILTHRWVVGTTGPELSFGLLTWHATDGSLRRFGYVVRDGEAEAAEDVDVVLAMEPDGTTFRRGSATWTLAGGETLTLDCQPIDAIVSERNGVAWVDGLCEIEHDGRRGFCCLEGSNNSRGGSGPVRAAVAAVLEQGLSRRELASVV